MKKLILILFLISFSGAFSQEICNNGIDDDFDGLIDLLDPECDCRTNNNSSLIPNHKFEEYSICPTSTSQINRTISWTQGTFAKPTYMNKCGFVLPDLYNYPSEETEFFPSGDGIAGAVMSKPYNEYIKSTLTTPIPAGTDCQLKMKIAAIIYKNNPGDYTLNISQLTPVNLTIYGSPIQSNSLIATFTSPIINGSPWAEIGSAIFNPKAKWQDLTINFTSTIEIKEIMIGAPEILPDVYDIPLMTIGSFPYFIYDDIVLNKLSNFDLFINKTGDLCSNNLTLTANLNAPTTGNVVYQWFKGELPIYFNGNSATFDVSNSLFLNKEGDYIVKIFDDNNCYTSNFTVNALSQSPSIIMTPPNCVNLASVQITSPAEEYSIDNGLNWSSNPFFGSLLPGIYDILTRSNNCMSNLRTIIIPGRMTNLPNPTITINQPNSCADIGEIIINTTSDFYSFDNGNTWTNNNTLSNVTPGDYYVLIKDTFECISLPLLVRINSYTNNYLPPIGESIQYFCINENATLENINITGTNIKWYDAPNGGNLLTNSTILENGVSYFCSQSVNNCESENRLEVTIFLTTTLNANNYNTMICDYGNDEKEFINLSNYNTNLSSTNNYFFDYYNSYSGAENQILSDEILDFSNYELTIGTKVIYVRISNQSTCIKIVELNLTLLDNPVVNIDDEIAICNGKPLMVSSNEGYDYYLWSTGETSNPITITQPGNYSVTVSEYHNSLTCSSTKNFSVVESNNATVSEIKTSEWLEDNKVINVILSPSSIGNYEFSIDGINFQNSNTFSGLAGGNYTIYVRDINGCGDVEKDFYLLSYPKFFTPNGDGHNDEWKIKFSPSEENFTTKIFDRYGKLLKVFSNKESWDGNYNGKQLPSDDYWFQITRNDGRIHRGHFTMKR